MTSVIFRKLSAVELQLYSPSLCLPCVDTDSRGIATLCQLNQLPLWTDRLLKRWY